MAEKKNFEIARKLETSFNNSVQEAINVIDKIPELKNVTKEFVVHYCLAPTETIQPEKESKPIILITLAYTKLPLDQSVFSLTHEIAHIRLGHVKSGRHNYGQEIEANEQALSWLRDNLRYEKYRK